MATVTGITATNTMMNHKGAAHPGGSLVYIVLWRNAEKASPGGKLAKIFDF